MRRQDQANDQFSLTSFLYGGNASYVEELQAQYEKDPNSVNAEWRDFFASLKDEPEDVIRNARGASWKKPGWPIVANGELVSALDGNWGLVEKHIERKVREKAASGGAELGETEIHQQTRDSVHAIMMIRAYRMRGHLHANLDPLGIAKPLEDYNELSPENYGFTEADYDRPIFIDNVLGSLLAHWRPSFEAGLREFQQACRTANPDAASFAALSPSRQIEFLRTVETTRFFDQARLLTLCGMFTNPSYGGNRDGLGWKLIGFEDQHVFEPPFGYYDRDYPGFTPSPGKSS